MMRKIAFAGLAVLATVLVIRPTTGHCEEKKKKQKRPEADLSKPFDHGTHFTELRKQGDRLLTCRDCHTQSSTVGDDFPICKQVRMPFPTHEKCTGCHPKAFWTRPLQICSNCHIETKFTEQPPLKEQTGKDAPLRTEFSHKLHLDPRQRVKQKFKFKKDCTFCHTFIRGGEKVALPNHAQCCECHTKADVEPNINDCAGCHSRPRWHAKKKSTIKNFSHADHSIDPRTGQSLDCLRCHAAVPKAKTVKQITWPVMATCVDCHAGEVAFDYSNCLKCHAADIGDKPIPESHKAATEGK